MIKIASDIDISMVTEVALKLWPNHDFKQLKNELNQIISKEDAMIVLFIKNEKPIGFAQCQLRYDYVEGTIGGPVGYLEGVYVDENHRNQGIAKSMVNYCEKWTKEKGCSEFASDCEIDNIDSLNFHLHLGFIEVNRIICFNKRIGENIQ